MNDCQYHPRRGMLPGNRTITGYALKDDEQLISEIRSGDCAGIEIPSGFSVFCDMDGTLVDTDYANYLAYRRAVIEATHGTYDLAFSDERINRESLKKQLPSLAAVQIEALVSLKEKYFNEFLSYTRLNTELAQLITDHQTRNTMVLVTFSREKRVVEVLKHHKLVGCFSRLICWESLPHGGAQNKYETAMMLTGASQKSVVVLENDNFGIEQAVLAGVPRRQIYRIIPGRGQVL